MPPRLPTPSALRASTQCLLSRFFSSTAPARNPPFRSSSKPSPGTTTQTSAASSPDAASSSSSSPSSSSSSSSSSPTFTTTPFGSNRAKHGGGNGVRIIDMVNKSSRKPFQRSIKPGDAASRVMNQLNTRARNTARDAMTLLEEQKNQKLAKDYLRQMPRTWVPGDVYSPHDMSPQQMQKWRRRATRDGDVIDALGIRPVDMYTNFSLISEFTTGSGMIKHSALTKLRPVNQRKIAKMVRRAQGMGLYPTIHGHPEMIRQDFLPPRRS